MFTLIFIGLSLLAGAIILGFKRFLNAELSCTKGMLHMYLSPLEYELFRTDTGKARSLDEVRDRVYGGTKSEEYDVRRLYRKTNAIQQQG